MAFKVVRHSLVMGNAEHLIVTT